MTSKQLFEYALIELNKREAPSLLLEDYNYFINKAINQFINKVYNAYDVNQQKSDDLRVLKATTVLVPVLNNEYTTSALFSKVYEVDLPDDYLHILNCVVEYKLLKEYKCYNTNDYWQQGAKRLTADMFSQILNNYYLRPSYKNPYFYINNISTDSTYPINGTPTSIEIGSSVTDSWLITYVASAGSLTITKDNAIYEFTYAASNPGVTEYTTIAQLSNLLLNIGIPTTLVGTTTLVINNAIALGIASTNALVGTSGITVISGPVINSIIDTYLIAFVPGTDSVIVVKDGITNTFTYAASNPNSVQYTTQLQLASLLFNIGIPTVSIGTNLIINEASKLNISTITNSGTTLTITSGPAATSVDSLIQKVASYRYGNRSKVRMEIRYGKDNSVFQLARIYVDYLKAPQFIRLTQEQVDEVEDNSQLLEFPDYVSQEVVNELIRLLMENASDPRLQTHIPVNQSISTPQQDQPQAKR